MESTILPRVTKKGESTKAHVAKKLEKIPMADKLLQLKSMKVISSKDTEAHENTLKPKDMYSNLYPITLDIQHLGPPLEESKKLKSSIKDPFFALSSVSYSNIASTDPVIRGPSGNSFYDALYLAWVSHGQLVLSPDDLWIQIAIETAVLIDIDAEKLRKVNVSHTGQKQLVVQTTNEKCFQDWKSAEYRWDVVIGEMVKLIENDLKSDLADPFLIPFSTSGLIEKSLSEICLMHCCQKYYEYVHKRCVCGIEKVHYLGKITDWDLLVDKVKMIHKYSEKNDLSELEFYTTRLLQTLLSIREGYNGFNDLEFWNSIFIKNYKMKHQYGVSPPKEGYELNGWANHFIFRNVLSMKDVKTRYVKAPLMITDGVTSESIMIMGGFSGVLEEGDVYRPVMTMGMSNKCLDIEQLLSVTIPKIH